MTVNGETRWGDEMERWRRPIWEMTCSGSGMTRLGVVYKSSLTDSRR